ncbi:MULTISPECIES: alpha-L-arabinofuranosidase C-terminal domain-containing protein [unclassified Rathayibacter]|uniref:arabinosylfuranosidase ArfA n=1 Tax=unclassified Rathayibacter TaxID=2609250 RepID=UPI0010473C75|nr:MULTISPECIES: alpha-L-arabinofuranosidase C-terminal domain-containing protein [unclassified Rathayibacter]MCJ1702489.1 alpha-L-arabinofuranosidase [Rathayibacter sp. VKM Ac-2926]TCL85669.1 alpha-N-arabinofuranosidase [Rathayibacter sp. PhB192]TCM31490.1 alpha-N-arabinofuranosidase [Rathayibacter sp. PhB179]
MTDSSATSSPAAAAAARVFLDPAAVVAPVNPRLFGSFVEHLGRCVYDGIYEPGHPTANEDGFRLDVVELVKELGSTTVRYPGGNFVSGYRWEDGVGPREDRPRRRDLAWHSLETNEVGLDDFAKWAKLTGSEIMYAVNLGTRGVLEALDVLEYANGKAGTFLADQRIANGSPEPHDIRMWCLGNEMDGPWQVGHMNADDYGKLASRTAKALKIADPSLELVICGSSGSSMPTFGEWERVVLEHAYDDVEYVSCHAYYQEYDGDLGSFLASSVEMEYFIATVAATVDHVKHKLRKTKDIKLSFDEWNVWYLQEWTEKEKADAEGDQSTREWAYAPRLLEDVYSVADAVVLGNLMITLLKNSDRVTSASLAQLVNVIAPIMTEPGGAAWRQTTFFPFSTTARLASGSVLKPRIEVGSYSTARHGDAPLVDSVATLDDGRAAVFLVNRSTTDALEVTVDVNGLGVSTVAEAVALFDEDVYAKNTKDDQNRVGLKPVDADLADGVLTLTLPPVSWTAVALTA